MAVSSKVGEAYTAVEASARNELETARALGNTERVKAAEKVLASLGTQQAPESVPDKDRDAIAEREAEAEISKHETALKRLKAARGDQTVVPQGRSKPPSVQA